VKDGCNDRDRGHYNTDEEKTMAVLMINKTTLLLSAISLISPLSALQEKTVHVILVDKTLTTSVYIYYTASG
jgi:hypothetical protein